jgi:hypothetical protein
MNRLTGNNLIDGDDGRHPFSPKYKEREDEERPIEWDWCVMCGGFYDRVQGGTSDACGSCMHDDDYVLFKSKEGGTK